MPTQLPSGRWRTRVRHPRTGRQMSARAVIGGPVTYATEDGAADAEKEARRLLHQNARVGVTVREFWQDWTTDPLWLRPATSTNLHYRERTSAFVAVYGDLPLRAVGDEHVAAWLKGGRNRGTVQFLRTFFNDAMSAPAGRLVDRNPFARLGIRQSRGRRDTQPPGQVDIARFVAAADELTPPSFAAFLDVAVHEGMRPGELDALRWDRIDFQAGTILVDQQWNAKVREFTLPKHGHVRTIALTDPARRRLLDLPYESEFAFTTLRGSHYSPSARCYHWNRVRCAVGLGNVDLYTATRHYFGWYALNVLELPAHVIALHFGHQDGGKLVRTNYGHPDAAIARERIREAFGRAPAAPVPIATAALAVRVPE
jgi:integrase